MLIFMRVFEIIKTEGLFALLKKCKGRIIIFNFQKEIKKKNWDEACRLGENLILLYPNNKHFHLLLAESYYKINNNARANDIIEKCMKLNFKLNKVIKTIENNINFGASIHSRYIQLGGGQNLGFIEHSRNDKKLLTKINVEPERERIFYSALYNRFPKLKDITPKLENISDINSGEISFITMDKIEGEKPIFNEEFIKEVIKINKLITTIKYEEIIKLIPVQDCNEFNERDIVDNRIVPLGILRSFTTIHKESTNKMMLNAILLKMEKLKYSEHSVELMQRLKKIIIDKKMYNNIQPEIHFSLQHGDLISSNMIVETNSRKLYILDWGQVRLGPSWFDIAGFLGLLKEPFDVISKLFLTDRDASRNLDTIGKLFCIYALIVVWSVVFNKIEFDTIHDTHLLPAMEHLEYLGNAILNNKEIVYG